MSSRYNFKELESKWRTYWEKIDLYKTGDDPDKPKYYILDYFPYPSGDGLSVGHCRNYVPTCVSARFKRMRGFSVLHPMGWDAFGLPAENYAIAHGVHPRITTAKHNANYKRQMQLIECSYDWSREFSSTDPDYYRWTQWFFLLLFKRGLAYQDMGSQWWCPIDKTILANEQVENGRCWRCGSLVTKKKLKQWYFRITDYADRLVDGLETVDWPEPIKIMQRNWVGRSEGAEVLFKVRNPANHGPTKEHRIPTFTTRPDTLFGVTFLILAPEHPLVKEITTEDHRNEVVAYVDKAVRMTEIDRLAVDKEKSGVFTGAYAAHPLTGDGIPIWVADYVMMEYGSGAIMGVPGHDTRDFEFARRFDLPIIEVISPDGQEHGNDQCFVEKGIMINSGDYSGQSSENGGERIVQDLARQGLGEARISYRMHDWLISRQRYWGAPIPIVHCHDCGPVAVPEDDLPVLLPEIDDFEPTGDGRSPLARIDNWISTPCPQCGEPAERETDTMDGFACSSWYFLRFASPDYSEGPFEPEATRYWMPVDTYVGGAEHAVMHLLYARFWTKVMFDAGLLPYDEPFSELRNQGVLHASDGVRMSKSKGNVVTPDEVVAVHGADALRAYILFIGPFDGDVIWDDTNIRGVDRFLERYWKLAQAVLLADDVVTGGQGDKVTREDMTTDKEVEFTREIHRVVKRVTNDLENFKFNTAVAALMQYLNYLYDRQEDGIGADLWREAIETFTILLCPIAPFITEEIWQEVLGHKADSVHQVEWPSYDEELIAADEMVIMIQVNGRLRDKVTVPVQISGDELREVVLVRPKVKRYIEGKEVRRFIIVPEKLVNVVVN
jgi:leucyl-tRNA synthetase